MKDDLNKTIESIGYALKPDYDRITDAPRDRVVAGPNHWDEVKDDVSAFGPEHDFELYDQDTRWVFYPVSKAAVHWARAKLPEHLDRWGAQGYIIPANEITLIVASARRDNLMSEQDWINANEEAANQAVQWEE